MPNTERKMSEQRSLVSASSVAKHSFRDNERAQDHICYIGLRSSYAVEQQASLVAS